MTLDAVVFYLFAAAALGSALVVVGQRHPTYSAFALIVTLCSLSAVFGLLGSPFIAVLQVTLAEHHLALGALAPASALALWHATKTAVAAVDRAATPDRRLARTAGVSTLVCTAFEGAGQAV